MRLTNRLNQFQRLWHPSAGEAQQVTVAELAQRCFCSERHIRTLLRQLASAGWISWQAQAGRGKRGQLTFLVTPEHVRAGMMEQVLNRGQHKNALELAQLAPEQLRHLLQPFLGGQWQNDTPTLRIPYYRPLERLTPGFLPGRAEQHLAGQIHSGLTRFDENGEFPQGDIAHHWQISPDGLRWDFYLRATLHWHNGKPVETQQLRCALLALLTDREIARLFASVAQIEMIHAQCLRITLHRPDYWLAHRLALYCSRLAHPDEPEIGCGPFRLTRFETDLVRLESHEFWHLSHPLLKAVEYWITPQLFDREMGNSCRHPVQIAIGQQDELVHLRPVSKGISLGFCYLALRQEGELSLAQARYLINLIHHSGMLDTLPLDEGLITPSSEMLPGWRLPEWAADEPPLPAKLTLVYHLPVELHAMAEQLKRYLAEKGCQLTVHFHPAKTWHGYQRLDQADLIMGDRLIGESPEFILEQWLRCDKLWPHVLTGRQFAHLQGTLDAVQIQADEKQRRDGMREVYTRLMADAVITPLFNYRYQVSAPPGVNGIALNARGWFDFTRAWLPPPVTP